MSLRAGRLLARQLYLKSYLKTTFCQHNAALTLLYRTTITRPDSRKHTKSWKLCELLAIIWYKQCRSTIFWHYYEFHQSVDFARAEGRWKAYFETRPVLYLESYIITPLVSVRIWIEACNDRVQLLPIVIQVFGYTRSCSYCLHTTLMLANNMRWQTDPYSSSCVYICKEGDFSISEKKLCKTKYRTCHM